jgi:O-succinylbenzoate synthase
LGVQKKEAVAKLVAMADKDTATFWKIYADYQKENKKVAKVRLGLYERTAQAYANMTPALADSLSLQYFANRSNQEKMVEEYYNRIKKEINAVVAFEFYLAEAYLLTSMRAQIMQQIPTFGQLVNASKK